MSELAPTAVTDFFIVTTSFLAGYLCCLLLRTRARSVDQGVDVEYYRGSVASISNKIYDMNLKLSDVARQLAGQHVQDVCSAIDHRAYRVNVTSGKTAWLIHVPEIDKWTQAHQLSDIYKMASDLIHVTTEIDPSSIDLDILISPTKTDEGGPSASLSIKVPDTKPEAAGCE